MARRKKDPGLTKIILGIVLIGGVVLGLFRFSEWFNQEFIVGKIESEATENLQIARGMIDSENLTEARGLLEPIISRVDNANITPKALILQAELEHQSEALDAALATLEALMERYPTSAEQPLAAIQYAKLLEEQGRFDEAVTVYTKLRENTPPALRAPAISGLARQRERDGDKALARDLYQLALKDAKWGSDAWTEASGRLGDLNVESMFSSAPTPDSKVYRVSSGDTLTSIGMKLNTTQGLLLQANGLSDPNRLRLNQNMKYTPKDFHIYIERTTCRLFLMDNDGLFKVYKVGLGKSGQETSVGSYHIGNKEKDPTWHKPGYGPIPPGDPLNELGTRWMPLVPEEEELPRDLGIHGTIAPETVGKYTSMGCPRLLPGEIEELYDLVVRSTPVTIVDVFNPDTMS